MAQWQVQIGQKVHGPFSSEQLKQLAAQGKLPQNALVRQGNEGSWHAASSIRGLFDAAGAPPPLQQQRQPMQQQPTQPLQQQPTQPFPQQPVQPIQQQQMPQIQPVQQMPAAQSFGTPGYGTPTQPMYQQSGGGGEPARWRKVSIGLFILAITTCVLAGAAALGAVSEGLMEIAGLMAVSSADPPKRPSMQFSSSPSDRASRMQEMQDYSERMRKWSEERQGKAKTIRGFTDAGEVVYKIARIVFLLAGAASIVGYVFCCFAPNRKGVMGLAITVVSIAGVNLILQLVFKLIRTFDDKFPYDHILFATFAARFSDTGDTLLAMFIDTAMVAELIIFAILLLMLGKAKGAPNLSRNAMFALCMFSGFGGGLLLIYIWAFIDFDLSSRWPTYVSWFFHWIANAALGVGLFFLIRSLFSAKNIVVGGSQKSAPAWQQ